ncbi:OB-fold domain-containing protein [Nocardia sp. NPDC005366]|uniref:Zn-ribbon domain-containing OB-fold protein n=1 Tax=Nocardia sp. NPDC005366 TaxID=3156878 RepID=UPI0033A9299C
MDSQRGPGGRIPAEQSRAADTVSATEAVAPTLEAVFERYPRIRLDQVNIEYYRGMLMHELRAGWCPACGLWHTPLRPICPSCWSGNVVARAVQGTGTVHLLTLLHQGPPVVDYTEPWPLAAVELTEQPGLRIVGPLVDTPAELQRIGQSVELTWMERDGSPWPAFRAVPDKEETR